MKKILTCLIFAFAFLLHASDSQEDFDAPEFIQSFLHQSNEWEYTPQWWTKESINLTSADFEWVMKKYTKAFEKRMNIYIEQNPDIFQKIKSTKKLFHKNHSTHKNDLKVLCFPIYCRLKAVPQTINLSVVPDETITWCHNPTSENMKYNYFQLITPKSKEILSREACPYKSDRACYHFDRYKERGVCDVWMKFPNTFEFIFEMETHKVFVNKSKSYHMGSNEFFKIKPAKWLRWSKKGYPQLLLGTYNFDTERWKNRNSTIKSYPYFEKDYQEACKIYPFKNEDEYMKLKSIFLPEKNIENED
ncbi:MAG: hypothetical protein ACRYGR_02025 [Janthinobacterium lividum]